MGTGPAFATAVKLARPGSRVVLVTGDGSIGLAPGFTPLETSIDYNAPVTVIIANNSQWGMIKNQQKSMWGRECGTSLRNIDYYKIFEAAGAYAELIEQPDDIKQALKRAWASGKTACLEIKTKADPSPMTAGLIEMRVKTSIE
jgi:acetolactate synthase-1/2/3 large subunit